MSKETLPERLEQRQLLQGKWLAGMLTYLVALLTVLTTGIGGSAIYLGCGIIAATFAIFPSLSHKASRHLWSALSVVVLVWVIIDTLLSGSDLIPPMIRMITLLGLLRAIAPRKRRQDLQLVLLALFMVVLSGVLTVSLLFALQLLLFTPLVMISLFVITLADSVEKRQSVRGLWDDFRWRQMWGAIRSSFNWRLLCMWGLLYAGLLAGTAIIFMALPRFRLDHAIPFLRAPAQKSLSGFSDSITFGDVVDIILDDAVALRVDVPQGLDLPLRPYWRMVALDEYHGEGFRVSSSARKAVSQLSDSYFPLRQGADGDPSQGSWTFYMEGGISRYLPLPGMAQSLRFQTRQNLEVNHHTRSIATREIPGNVLFFQTSHVRHDAWMPAARVDQRVLPNLRDDPAALQHQQQYPYTTLALPTGSDDRETLKRLLDAAGVAPAGDPHEAAQKLTEWLEQGKDYSLSVSLRSRDGDPLVAWLNSPSPGHCELFAGGFTLLMRAAGHPARVVTGFAGGTWNGYENYYMVRNSDAHARVEYFAGDAWHRADPTPGATQAAAMQGAASLLMDRTFGAYLDSLRILWYRRIVNFDEQQQRELAGWVKLHLDSLRESVAGWWQASKGDFRSWIKNPWDTGRLLPLLRNLLFAVALWFALRFLFKRLRGLHYKKQGRDRHHPVRTRAGALMQRVQKLPASAARQALLLDLQLIRYGHPQTWPDPAATFKQARRVLVKRGRTAPDRTARA